MGADALNALVMKIKDKHGLAHCHHACYSLSGLFKVVSCECCGDHHYVAQYYNPSDAGSYLCSTECSKLFRLCEKLKARAELKTVSTRFKRAKGDSNLQKFLNYLVGQNTIKRKKINRGGFTWS